MVTPRKTAAEEEVGNMAKSQKSATEEVGVVATSLKMESEEMEESAVTSESDGIESEAEYELDGEVDKDDQTNPLDDTNPFKDETSDDESQDVESGGMANKDDDTERTLPSKTDVESQQLVEKETKDEITESGIKTAEVCTENNRKNDEKDIDESLTPAQNTDHAAESEVPGNDSLSVKSLIEENEKRDDEREVEKNGSESEDEGAGVVGESKETEVSKDSEETEYPDDLNPFDIEEENSKDLKKDDSNEGVHDSSLMKSPCNESKTKPTSLNPFGSSDESDADESTVKTTPSAKNKTSEQVQLLGYFFIKLTQTFRPWYSTTNEPQAVLELFIQFRDSSLSMKITLFWYTVLLGSVYLYLLFEFSI